MESVRARVAKKKKLALWARNHEPIAVRKWDLGGFANCKKFKFRCGAFSVEEREEQSPRICMSPRLFWGGKKGGVYCGNLVKVSLDGTRGIGRRGPTRNAWVWMLVNLVSRSCFLGWLDEDSKVRRGGVAAFFGGVWSGLGSGLSGQQTSPTPQGPIAKVSGTQYFLGVCSISVIKIGRDAGKKRNVGLRALTTADS